ncbi:MAG: HYR domain-containing protein, partial [Saprospiraceae bacterium]|nr:HYR domain-containing protein [Saprospiraceae bacterium]
MKNFTLFSLLGFLLMSALGQAQVFNGSTVNTAGNTLIPSTGTGGCTVAPQTTGGTFFNVAVAGVPATSAVQTVLLNLNHTSDADLDIFLISPGGQILELSTDNGGTGDNFTNTVFCDFAPLSIVGQTAPFTGFFRPEGSLLSQTCGTNITPNITTLGAFNAALHNGTWQLVIKDDLGANTGAMLNWSITFGPNCNFSLATLPPVVLNSATNATTCGVSNANVTAPTLTCGTAAVLDVELDGVLIATGVPGGGTFQVTTGAGSHILRYTIQGSCRQITQNLTVNDLAPPTITCPANITLNLGPGECSTFYNYNVEVTDNCPFFGPTTTLNTNTVTNNGQSGVQFDIVNNTNQPMNILGFGADFFTAAGNALVDVYVTNGNTAIGVANNPAAWTLLGTDPVVPIAAGTAASPIDVGGLVLQPGESKGIYLRTTQTIGYQGTTAANGNATVTDGSLTIISNGHSGVAGTFGALFTPRAFVGFVTYQTSVDPAPVQITGLPSGAEFPIGVTENCFVATDANGNTASCCFTVTVNEFPNATQSLVCNDLVNISLDSSCTHVLGADQVLEGGPYRCYDNYIVQLDRIAPFGNGPWTPAVLGPGDVGKSYAYRVVDPATNNTCWGMVLVEDKLPPVLSCPLAFATCGDDLTPCASPGGFGPAVGLTNHPNPIPNTSFFNGFAGVTFDVRNDGAQPIQISGFETFLNPPVTHTIRVFFTTTATTNVGNQLNANAWTLLGTAQVQGTAAVNFAGPKSIIPIGGLVLQPGESKGIYIETNQGGAALRYTNGAFTATDGTLAVLSNGFAGGPNFANTFASRAFVGTVQYQTQGAAPCLPNELELNVNAFPIGPNTYRANIGAGSPVMESCSDVTLTYSDSELPQNCNGLQKIVNRKWTANDASGNTSVCIQEIRVAAPSLMQITTPPNYDDIDSSAFLCTGVYPTPEYIESTGQQGFPYYNGNPVACGLSIDYHDKVIDVCDGTYKIRREWLLIDWCTGEDLEYVQLIKVKDDEPPVFDCPANLTVTTDPFNCCATVDLPDVIVSDVCSRINKVSAMIIGISPVAPFDTIGMFTVGGSLTSFPG